MLDYHLHLWPHEQRDTELSLEQVSRYCDRASAAGVTEVALTEHFFRFVQATEIVGRFWETDECPAALRGSMARYWDHHARSDLDVICFHETRHRPQ